MIKIRIRNDDHEIDLQFPISENKLYAKLAEIHAIEGKDSKLPCTIESSNEIARIGWLLSQFEGSLYDYRFFM